MIGRKTTVVFVLFMIVSYAAASAQAPDTLWTKNYGFGGNDEAWQLKQTPDGSFVIIGFKESGNPVDSDIYFIKTDEHGDTLWTRTYDYSIDDVGRSVEPLDNGDYVITGQANNQCILIKTDSLGNELWHTYLSGVYGRAVRATSDGNLIIAGYKIVPENTYDMYLAKTDSSGNIEWESNYGGTYTEMAWDVRETEDGGFVLVGWTTLTNGYADIYLVKTDSNGDSLWSRTYGGSSNDEGRSILVKEDGGFIIAGKLSNNKAIINTDQNGDTLWTRTYPDNSVSIANSISTTIDGGYILASVSIGTVKSSAVIKITPNGDSLWSRVLEDPEQDLYVRSIVQTDDGGFVVAGYHQVSLYSDDVFLCKLAAEATRIDDPEIALPDKVALHQSYPNPFNASTTISFSLAKPEYATLSVYDLLGRKVQIITDGYFDAGEYNYRWNAEDHNSGIYFYHLKAGDINESNSMILLK